MASRVALSLSAQSQGVSWMETNATEALWRTGRTQGPPLPIGGHLGTVESGDGRS